jgi:glucuronate isomerase
MTGLPPDRLFPPDPATREVARFLYGEIEDFPLVAVHGHVEASMLEADGPFHDPAELLVTSDHYVLRVLHSIGVPLDQLGVAAGAASDKGDASDKGGASDNPVDARSIWRLFCRHWKAFRGTSTRLWLEHELTALFGVELPLTERTADASYDTIAACLADDAYRPQALFRRFDLEVLSTTDRPGADFGPHDALQAAGLAAVPTLRPDNLTDPTRADWAESMDEAGITSYDGLVAYLRAERRRSVEHGAVATDHGHVRADTEDLGHVEAGHLFDRVRAAQGGAAGGGAGEAERRDAQRLAAQLLTVNALLALDDGLVMQLHTGVRRDHDRQAAARYGADVGADFPIATTFTDGLQAVLGRCGNEPGFRLVVFTVDETVYSRELAPMASYWPGLYLGAPWWFLDAPDAMGSHFSATAESAGYAKLTGFVDDTRAFCSIPARHDVARRVIAAHLARLVVEHRLTEEDALAVATDYAYRQPRAVYRVGPRPGG